MVLGRCSKFRQPHVLKIHGNNLADDAAEKIARFIKTCGIEFLEQLDLSYNLLALVGVEDILKAVHDTRNMRSKPLWIRLHTNRVSEPSTTLAELKRLLSLNYGVCFHRAEMSRSPTMQTESARAERALSPPPPGLAPYGTPRTC